MGEDSDKFDFVFLSLLFIFIIDKQCCVSFESLAVIQLYIHLDPFVSKFSSHSLQNIDSARRYALVGRRF